MAYRPYRKMRFVVFLASFLSTVLLANAALLGRPSCFLHVTARRAKLNKVGKALMYQRNSGHSATNPQQRYLLELDELIQSDLSQLSSYNATAQALSRYYQQDRNDPRAESFIKDLSSSDKYILRNHLKDLYQARRRRDYKKGDQITALLKRKFQVRIYNYPPVWTTQKNAAPMSYIKNKQTKLTDDLINRYGPNGHPYIHVGEGIDALICPLSSEDINSLLSRKTREWLEGRYEQADAIKFELSTNGVQVNDISYQWRADGCCTWETEPPEIKE